MFGNIAKNTSLGEVVTISAVAIVIVLMLRLGSDNKRLSEENGRLSAQTSELGNKNDSLATSLQNLTVEVQAMNKLVAAESKRRAAAEMKSQRLQDEVKNALKDNQNAAGTIPFDAVVRLLEAANSARGGKDKQPADISKSPD